MLLYSYIRHPEHGSGAITVRLHYPISLITLITGYVDWHITSRCSSTDYNKCKACSQDRILIQLFRIKVTQRRYHRLRKDNVKRLKRLLWDNQEPEGVRILLPLIICHLKIRTSICLLSYISWMIRQLILLIQETSRLCTTTILKSVQDRISVIWWYCLVSAIVTWTHKLYMLCVILQHWISLW